MPGISIDIEFVNFEQAVAQLNGMGDKVQRACVESANEIAEYGLDGIHSNLYPGHGYRTGNLYRSYYGRRSGGGYVVDVTFGTECEYASYVEYRWGGRISHFRPAMQGVAFFGPAIIEKKFDEILG